MNGELARQKETKSIFKNYNFMLLLVGQNVSNIGNGIHYTAVIVYLLSLLGEVGSGFHIAILSLCSSIPRIVLSPFLGVYVDKIDRKKIIVLTDIFRGACILVLSMLQLTNRLSLTAIFVVTTINAIVGTLFNPAVMASIPNIVHHNNLTQANSLNEMSIKLSYIVGAALCGFIYAPFGILGVFLINGVSYVLSGISEMFIKMPAIEIDETKEKVVKISKIKEFWNDFIEGLLFLKSKIVLMYLSGFALILNFFITPLLVIVLPKIIKFTLDLGPKELGIIDGMMPLGTILGMIVLSMLKEREKNFGLFSKGLVMEGVIIFLVGLPIIPQIQPYLSNYLIYLILCGLMLLLGGVLAFVNVPLLATIQKIVPDIYRGRFFSILTTLTMGITPLGTLFIGLVSDNMIPANIFLLVGFISFVASLGIFIVPKIREL